MGKVDLQSDEVIVRETNSVTVRSIPLDAVLTTRRLILVDSRTDTPLQKNIPLAAIREVRLEKDTGKNPSIILSIMTETGTIRQMIIIFPQTGGIGRQTECEEWVQSLEERTATTRATAHVNILTLAKPGAEVKPGILPVGEPVVPPKARDWAPDFTPFIPKSQPEPVNPPKQSRFIKIGAIILAIVVIIGVVYAVGQLTKGTSAPPQTVTALTTSATPLPSLTPAQISQALPTTVVSPLSTAPPKFLIPDKGIWVRVKYPGNYIGYIGTRGQYKQLNSTGEQYLQLPMVNGTIDGSIEKQDGSSDNLIVEIYKNGALITQKSTRAPQGVLDLHISV